MINKILYKDFEPKVLDKSFWGGSSYEPMETVMERVNEWIRKNYNNEIINVETVQLPANPSQRPNSSTSKLNSGGGYIYLLQVVRVWYK